MHVSERPNTAPAVSEKQLADYVARFIVASAEGSESSLNHVVASLQKAIFSSLLREAGGISRSTDGKIDVDQAQVATVLEAIPWACLGAMAFNAECLIHLVRKSGERLGRNQVRQSLAQDLNEVLGALHDVLDMRSSNIPPGEDAAAFGEMHAGTRH